MSTDASVSPRNLEAAEVGPSCSATSDVECISSEELSQWLENKGIQWAFCKAFEGNVYD